MNAVESITPTEASEARFVPLQTDARKRDHNDAAVRLEELFAQLDSIPTPAAREIATESVQSVVTLYGEALGRIVKLINRDDNTMMSSVLKDELLRSLLLVHDLHPQSLDERLLGALDSVRPYLKSHGGNIDVLGVHDGIARLRFQGTCKTCPSSAVTLELAIRRAVNEACPDLIGLELEQAELEKAKS
jgi:Fe-S cluster biogenesis protein NfuA